MARPLAWQTVRLSLATSLDTSGDARASDPRMLDIARDIQYDEDNGAQTRHPFGTVFNSIFGGGTLANCRRVVPNGDELVVMTDTGVLSWNAQLSKWVSRGTHLAVAVTETPRFATSGDQNDGDRAELNNTIVYAWLEGSQVFAAAIDKTTKSVLVAPTAVTSAISRPRLVALGTKILLFNVTSPNNLVVRSIDPAAPATGIASASTNVTTVLNGPYDVVKVDSQDLCIGVFQRTTTTSYTVFTCTPALSLTSSTKARTADGPLSVSTVPGGGLQAQVIRSVGANLKGDLLTTSSLADVLVDTALGSAATPINEIAACYRSVQNGGFFRCYFFVTGGVTTTNMVNGTTTGFVDTSGATGSGGMVTSQVSVASRAFDCNGSVYAWCAFGSVTTFTVGSTVTVGTTLQNSYFLYRDDGFLVAKAVAARGGGYTPLSGCLPGVSAVSSTSFAWLGAQRRRFDAAVEGRTDFAAREPVDITFQFDSTNARRSARIGETLYIAAGEILQYDGVRLIETGFHVFPWQVALTESGGGSLTAGQSYSYKLTYRYLNSHGEIERSTTATIATITLTTGTLVTVGSLSGLAVSHKTDVLPAVEAWRTLGNQGVGAPFHLITSNDPTQTSNPNKYTPNIPSIANPINDVLADTALAPLEANPENGDVLESLGPPAASIIVATDTRLFLAGVSGDPDAIWPSRERNDGEVASFNDSLRVEVPREGGPITSIWFQDDVLFVSRQTAIYALPGTGLDNLGQGQGFGPPRIVSLDVGAVSHEAQALTPLGTIFKSSKGWYLLERGGTVRYIGNQVQRFDGDTVLSAHVMTSQHQVRILTNNRLLIWDYRSLVDPTDHSGQGRWAEWTVNDGVHACMWQGRYVYLTATGPRIEQTDFTGVNYGMDVESKWIPLPDLQSAAKCKAAGILGEWRSNHLLRIRVARDWQYDGAGNPVYFDDLCWTPSPQVVGNALQVLAGLSQDQMQAIKVRITAVTAGTSASLVTTALSPQVTTSGSVWNSTWTAASTLPGAMGNVVTMSLAFETVAAAFTIDVRQHFAWSISLQRWQESLNTIGVRVFGNTNPTVAQLEAAIAAGTTLATLTAADASPSKTVNIAAMNGLTSTGALTGGVYGTPTGEALKLTNLAFEVGVRPGINRRLPAGQKV